MTTIENAAAEVSDFVQTEARKLGWRVRVPGPGRFGSAGTYRLGVGIAAASVTDFVDKLQQLEDAWNERTDREYTVTLVPITYEPMTVSQSSDAIRRLVAERLGLETARMTTDEVDAAIKEVDPDAFSRMHGLLEAIDKQ